MILALVGGSWILAMGLPICGCGCDGGLSCLVMTVGFVDFGCGIGNGNGSGLWL